MAHLQATLMSRYDESDYDEESQDDFEYEDDMDVEKGDRPTPRKSRRSRRYRDEGLFDQLGNKNVLIIAGVIALALCAIVYAGMALDQKMKLEMMKVEAENRPKTLEAQKDLAELEAKKVAEQREMTDRILGLLPKPPSKETEMYKLEIEKEHRDKEEARKDMELQYRQKRTEMLKENCDTSNERLTNLAHRNSQLSNATTMATVNATTNMTNTATNAGKTIAVQAL